MILLFQQGAIMSIEGIPRDVLIQIALQLDLPERVNLSRVAKVFARFWQDEPLWMPEVKALCLQKKPGETAYQTVKNFHARFNKRRHCCLLLFKS